MALALVAVVFGLQSAIDWTWFVPGPMAMTLVAAGFVAGRGPGRRWATRRPRQDGSRGRDARAPPRLFAGAAVR